MITREADYAIRCILYLSEKPTRLASVNEIAEPIGVSKTFLAKILQRLVKSGLVESIRGASGGFKLVTKPEDISLYDVVEAIDGPMSLNRCAIEPDACDRSGGCVIHPIWVDLTHHIEMKLRQYNFAHMSRMKRSGKVHLAPEKKQ